MPLWVSLPATVGSLYLVAFVLFNRGICGIDRSEK